MDWAPVVLRRHRCQKSISSASNRQASMATTRTGPTRCLPRAWMASRTAPAALAVAPPTRSAVRNGGMLWSVAYMHTPSRQHTAPTKPHQKGGQKKETHMKKIYTQN
ncbi:hypothetical protein TW95_gp1183 [Pandoravirus inopinatum]|uniref:Uncharacterized protein n=1 Tax=Pandoravirus inopinatum TaxID=1605721 RepID=A0A0B5JDU6_9VIRU|nr:hypothetical protein TW95_gp1183 [Pandoravirus inopinatum]AJF97917.1 hypothetical protein [Pandoravirus inopinatum]